MKTPRCHCNARLWQHPLLLLKFWLLTCTLLGQVCAWAQSPLEVGPNTTIFFADKLNALVLEDKAGTATLEDVRKRLTECSGFTQIRKLVSKPKHSSQKG